MSNHSDNVVILTVEEFERERNKAFERGVERGKLDAAIAVPQKWAILEPALRAWANYQSAVNTVWLYDRAVDYFKMAAGTPE